MAAGPATGFKTKVGAAGAVKVALPASPVAPVTVTVYVPCAPGAVRNEPDITPLTTLHTGLWIRPAGAEEIVQGPLSPGEGVVMKFEPETRTFVPPCPEVGVNVTVGFILNVAVAKSTGSPLGGVAPYP